MTSPYELSLEAAVVAFRRDELSGDDLFRAVMAHPAWIVPGESTSEGLRLGVLRTPDGGRILELFSSAEARDRFIAREGDPGADGLLELAGFELFAALQDGVVDRISIDQHSEHGLKYEGEHVPVLRAWATVARVELALCEPDRFGDPFPVLRAHPDYRVVMRRSLGDSELVLAPDEARSLAAVFTADDTADAFVRHAESAWEGAFEVVPQRAEDLFRMLGEIPLDGIVFNPLSHLRPVALHIGVLERLRPAVH